MQYKLISLILVVLAISANGSDAAQSLEITLDIHVTSCSGIAACATANPDYHFLQSWTLPNYTGGTVSLYDFGGGSSMLKAEAAGPALVSESPQYQDVLNAAAMTKSDVSPHYYFENATYLTNGVGNGQNIGDLQLRNEAVLKPANGDGTFLYKNYNQTLIFYFNDSFEIQTFTPENIEAYFSYNPSVVWRESGTLELLPDEIHSGVLLNSLYYGGTATFVGVSVVSEPSKYVMMMAGLILLAGAFRRLTRTP